MQNEGWTYSLEIPDLQWTILIGFDKKVAKWSMKVNGEDIRVLPKAPLTLSFYPTFCKSTEGKSYS